LALCLATGILGQIRHDEERAAGMDPAGRFENRSWFAIGVVELVVTTVSVSPEDPGVVTLIVSGRSGATTATLN
jgi:hypothetical protein